MTEITRDQDGQPLFDGMTVAQIVDHHEAIAAKLRNIYLRNEPADYERAAAALRHLSNMPQRDSNP